MEQRKEYNADKHPGLFVSNNDNASTDRRDANSVYII